ncbi:hypothetical protein [Paracoccus albus]|uniref:hypothetical protein n=1 Tax=Paracoccus albus TaxID=3017784 RepID=UPI0022F06F72|nr:hypothetical protein [Paracoccus albus]WBU61218.1 hypothetical protein PAF20_04735 [Paracoccus albus]
MTDAPRQLSLSQFLENSAALMAAFRNETDAVQVALGEHLQQLSPEVTERLNFTVFQSLDEHCQAFNDLSVAFEAVSKATGLVLLKEWPSTEEKLKLHRVKHALIYGDTATEANVMIEFF